MVVECTVFLVTGFRRKEIAFGLMWLSVGSVVAAEAIIVEATAMLGMVIIVMFKTMVALVVSTAFIIAAILVLAVVAPVDIIEVLKVSFMLIFSDVAEPMLPLTLAVVVAGVTTVLVESAIPWAVMMVVWG